MERAEAAEGAAWLQWRKVARKKHKRKRQRRREQTRTVRKEKLGMKSLKKWLQASRRRQARMMMTRRLHKEQLGKVSSKIGIARKSKTKKRRKRMTGERKTRWKCNGMRMRSWKRFWNEEGWKEALCRWKSCKRYQS